MWGNKSKMAEHQKTVTALEVKNLRKQFGGVSALNDVNMEVAVGERRAIIGPNGAGKTTLFNIINGAVRPSFGRVLMYGEDITRLAPHRRASLGLGRTFQISNLFPQLSVFENLRLALMAAHGVQFSMWRSAFGFKKIQHECEDRLKKWDLWPFRDDITTNLSYGIQRRMEIVLALCSKPKLLLLDEPTAGLSIAETSSILNAVRSLDRDTTILFIEHDMDVMYELADNITVLHQGTVLVQGSKEEVRHNAQVEEIYLGTASGQMACLR